MSEWRHFVHICRTCPRNDIIVLIITFVLTVVFDLVVAIGFGLVLTAILFIKDMSDVAYVRRWSDHDSQGDEEHIKPVPDHTLVYEIHGPVFFANSEKFVGLPFEKDTRVLILRMSDVPAIDASGMKTLETLLQDCRNKNIRLLLSHVGKQPLSAMMKSGFYAELGAKNFLANIDLALDKARRICDKETVKL